MHLQKITAYVIISLSTHSSIVAEVEPPIGPLRQDSRSHLIRTKIPAQHELLQQDATVIEICVPKFLKQLFIFDQLAYALSIMLYRTKYWKE